MNIEELRHNKHVENFYNTSTRLFEYEKDGITHVMIPDCMMCSDKRVSFCVDDDVIEYFSNTKQWWSTRTAYTHNLSDILDAFELNRLEMVVFWSTFEKCMYSKYTGFDFSELKAENLGLSIYEEVNNESS